MFVVHGWNPIILSNPWMYDIRDAALEQVSSICSNSI